MDLSLVLATCNNARLLKDFLKKLVTCDRPDKWEVIIVDNGSIDNTAKLSETFKNTLPIKYLYEGTRGKSRALNLGLRHANGAVVLFTDDDILPEKKWLINHITAMRNYPQASVIGGKIVVDTSKIPAWLNRSWNLKGILLSEHDLGDTYRIYDPGFCPYGPNMSVRRNCLQGCREPWPENIGPGTRFPIADETVFCHTISAMGPGERLYAPDCIVEHRPRIDNYFYFKAIRRCFLSGCISATLSLPASPQKKISDPWIAFFVARITRVRSIRELICDASRIAGYGWGRVRGKTIHVILMLVLAIPVVPE